MFQGSLLLEQNCPFERETVFRTEDTSHYRADVEICHHSNAKHASLCGQVQGLGMLHVLRHTAALFGGILTAQR